MTLVRLNKRSYIRLYEGIGYIFNELSHADTVFDEYGAIFLAEIGRKPKSISEVVKRISSKFVDGSPEEIDNDFREFVLELERGGFVITGQTVKELNEKEPVFAYSNVEVSPDASCASEDDVFLHSSEVLKEHFVAHPRLFSVQIELTSFCNLNCVHCYLGEEHHKGGIPKEKVFEILDQLNAMGTLQVSFTGGEVLSRPDLPEILRYARLKDFSITLLTNNTLLSDGMIEVFKDVTVRLVKISLYSMEPEIHDAITGKSGSWEKTVRNIEKLVASDVPIQISSPVMKENLASFVSVMQWGRSRGFNVKPDLYITARNDFSRDNLDHRLSLDECEKAVGSIIAIDGEYQRRLSLEFGGRRQRRLDDHLCGVGTSTISISANGDLYPCPVFPMKLANIADVAIADVWKHSASMCELRKVTYSSYSDCVKCADSIYCPICMGKMYSESAGDKFAPNEYFCYLANLTKKVVKGYNAG